MGQYNYKDLVRLELEVSKAKKGNIESKEYIIRFFEPFMIKMSKTTFIKNMDENDIKQSLVLHLLTAVQKYKGQNKFFWYAVQSMKNNIYAELKKRKRECNFIDIDKLPLSDEHNIDENIIKDEEIFELKNALCKLNKNDLELIYKFYFKDYDLKMLSNYFSCAYHAIGTRKSRALKKLKSIM